jgi:hypothetical protein
MSSYPAAEEVMKGSVSGLQRKIQKFRGVGLGERDRLLAMIRTITAEVVKLKLIQPPIHTNCELVELFLGHLSVEFARLVSSKLSMQRWINEKEAVLPGARNPEDMFDIEEVMEIAKQMSKEYSNPFGKYICASPGASGNETTGKLEETVAQLTDTLKLYDRRNAQIDQRLSILQNAVVRKLDEKTSLSNTVRPTMAKPSFFGPDDGCYYCAGPHRRPDCEHLQKHISLGWIKRVDGYLKLADGSRMPRDPAKSTKDLVEDLNRQAARAGIIPMNRLPEGAQLFQTSSEGNNSEWEAVAQLTHSLGVDQVRDFLEEALERQKEREDWESNFM